MASKKGKTICVFSAKGGVGKTTATLTMAGIFASMEKKVLILDFDIFNGGIALYLNKGINMTLYNTCDDLNNNRYTDLTTYVTKYNDFIDYIASPKDPRQGIKINSKYVETIIERAEYLYDVVLIDTTHALNNVTLSILDYVKHIIFLITNDPYDLKNLKSILTIFKELEINKYKIVLNNSIIPNKRYFSNYDIKSIIGANIDYIIPKEAFIKDFDNFVMDNILVSLEKRVPNSASIYSESLTRVAIDIIRSEETK